MGQRLTGAPWHVPCRHLLGNCRSHRRDFTYGSLSRLSDRQPCQAAYGLLGVRRWNFVAARIQHVGTLSASALGNRRRWRALGGKHDGPLDGKLCRVHHRTSHDSRAGDIPAGA